MSIVAISQTLGSLGDAIGRDLARALAWDFADREIIVKAAGRFGEGVTTLEHATDERPTLWERFTGTRDPYLTYVEAMIWEMATRGSVVLVGRGAPFLLAPTRHALRVRITAPEGLRARRVENQEGLTPDAARDVVRQSDRDRAARVKFLYQVEWDDPLLYDLVLNTEHLAVDGAVRMIQEVVRTERFQPTAESRQELKDRSITAAVKAALLAHPATRTLQVTLVCRDGHVSIGGSVEREEHRRAAEEVVGTLPGVAVVVNEIVVIPRRLISGI